MREAVYRLLKGAAVGNAVLVNFLFTLPVR